MKILYLIHQFYPAHHGGSEKFILQLAQRVQAAGHQVVVVAFDYHNRRAAQNKFVAPSASTLAHKNNHWQALLAPTLRHVRRSSLWRRWRNRLPDPLRSYTDTVEGVRVIGFRSRCVAQNNFHLHEPQLTHFATEVLEREAPDLIHAGYLLYTAEFLHVAQRLRIPYLITLTSHWLLCPKHTLLNAKAQICAGPRGGEECKSACPGFALDQVRLRYATMQQLLTHAAAIIAPSRHMAHLFQRELGPIDLTYLPYGMDCQHLPLNMRRTAAGQPLTFFFGGRLAPEKGVPLLLTAFRRLPAQHIRLHIYGVGHFAEAVQQAAQTDPRIHYGGIYTTTQVGSLLQQVDVVVVPSIWHENLPLIMQEAQACGVPTLVADVGGMTECVTDGVNGFIFRVGDVADLQAKMQMIIDQPELLNEIKEYMHNPKPGQYRVTSLEEEATLYLEEYTKIIDAQAMG